MDSYYPPIIVSDNLQIPCKHDLLLQCTCGDISCVQICCEFPFLTLNMGFNFSCALRRQKWAVDSDSECKTGRVNALYLCPYKCAQIVWRYICAVISYFIYVAVEGGDGQMSGQYRDYRRMFYIHCTGWTTLMPHISRN